MASGKTTKKSRAAAVARGLAGSGAYQQGNWGSTNPNGGGGGSPGVLSRVMDVLSRPNYAIAQGASRAQEGSGVGGYFAGWGKGLGEGITGKKKTSFMDVLQETENAPGFLKKGPGKAIAGLFLDIAADPTTYMGVGLAKTAAKESGVIGTKLLEAATKGEKANTVLSAATKGNKAVKVARAPKMAEKIVQDAGKVAPDWASVGRNVGPGVPGVTSKMGVAGTAVPDLAAAATKAGASAAPGVATGTRALELRILGKPIVASERAGAALQGLGNAAKATRPVEMLSQTFRPGHGVSKPVHELERMFAGRSRAHVADKAHEYRDAFKGLSREQDKILRTSVQEGTVHTLDDKLRPVGEFLQKELRSISKTDDEIARLEARLGMAEKRVARSTKETTMAKHTKTADNIRAKIEDSGKFKDYYAYKGAPKPYEKASHNLLVQYEDHARKRAYSDFLDEVSKRFPEAVPEIQARKAKINQVFGLKGENTAAWQHYMNTIQAPWKRYVTAYRPGFHIRNMLGDSFNNFLAGVKSEAYLKSGKILRHGGEDKILKLAGQDFTTAEIDRLYRKAGLETSFLRADEIERPIKGVGAWITEKGDTREKFMRMANFVDEFENGLKKGLSTDAAMEAAGTRVRKYNFDYADLTPAERNLRTFFPFYTWTRKEMPLILEHTLSNPGKILTVPKGTRAIEALAGVERDPDDPFPGIDDALPDWLKDKGIANLGKGNIASPGLPTDLLSMLNPATAVKETANMISPFLQAPVELASGKTFPEGMPQNQDLIRYLVGQFAPYGNLARDSKSTIKERLLNAMHGMGVRQMNN